jgi:trans-aconitate methyltransferase
VTKRPFYHSNADAYDLLINDPVEPWTEAIHERMGGIAGRILDAGCGTGRHAAALIALGHRVDLADASAELLAQAARRCPDSRTVQTDLCAMEPAADYDAVTCRGVLNDMVTDGERAAVMRTLAGSLRRGGLLFLDVRDAATTQARTFSRAVEDVTYTSRATWDGELLRVEEQFDDGPLYHFTMRPWTTDELTSRLTGNGLRDITIEPGVGRRTPDRLFVTARAF